MRFKTKMLLAGTAVLMGCSDVVSSRYENIAEARADNLFERGWLPDILPDTATSISTSNNLDINTSEGSFKVPAKDQKQFLKKLKYELPDKSGLGLWGKTKDAQGFEVGSYSIEKYDWVFACHETKGICEYKMR